MVGVFEIRDGVYVLAKHLKENKISVASFLILDELPVIIETGTPYVAKEFLRKLEEIIPLEKISYIFVTHEHLDHIGGLPEYISEAYNARIVLHHFLRAQLGFMGIVGRTVFVNGNETIPIGDRKIKAIYAPIETTGTTIFMLQPDRILFSGDYFGQLSEENWTLYPKVSSDQLVQTIKEFHQGLGYSREDVKKFLSPIEKMKPRIIVPSHGSLIKDDVKKVFKKVIEAKLKPEQKGSLWRRVFGR